MSKRKSDDDLEILEKPVKKKQILLNSFFSCSSTSNNANSDSKTKKTTSSAPRLVKYKTVEVNWIEKSLAPFDAKIWLQYDKDGEYATNFRCKVCTQFREHIKGIQYFKEDWIIGSTNYRSSNATDHAEGVPHKEAMKHYYKSVGKTHVEKRDRNQQSIESGLARMNEKDIILTRKKFDTAYFIAKEDLPLTKFVRILALEELHNVELGNAYRNNNMRGEFIDYIADDLASKVLQQLISSNLHSALWDATTDVSVPEKETIFVLYLDKVGSDGDVLVKTEFLGLTEINHARAGGIKQSIYESFEQIVM